MSRLLVLLLLSSTLVAPAAAASIARTYSYFSIGGQTLDEIETELGKRGPQIGDKGARHPGATRMEFTSRIGYAQGSGGRGGSFCLIQSARVSVKANVILPRWRQRKGSDTGTRLIWDTLAADIKRHEESHIGIAKTFAHELETSLEAIPRQPDCKAAAERAKAVTADLLARHDRAQARFDRIESKNFEARMLRLLRYRLERMQQGKLPG